VNGQAETGTDPGYQFYARGRTLAQQPTWSEMERWPISKQIRFYQYEIKLRKDSEKSKEHSDKGVV
jgi:hypothetical protein